jgi:general secretion pathway protein D
MYTSNLLIRLTLILLLSGCAAQQAYRDGKNLYETGHVEEGLAEIDKAYKLSPDNSEYRSQYYKLRDMAVYKWLAQAEAAKHEGQWEETATSYKRVLAVDPDNALAKIGLGSINREKQQFQLLAEARTLLQKEDLSGATKNVRLVLAESPSQSEALILKKSIEAKASEHNQFDVVFKSKLERPITIEFKDSPIKTIFDFISKVSGVNFLFDKEVRADLRASVLVRDTRIEDVIRFLLMSNQLEQRILNGNTLYIYPNTPQKIKDFQEMRVKNFYLSNANAKDVAAMLKGMVKTKDIFVDDKANLIMMRDTPDVIRVAERLVAAQDVAEPEAVLDVEVLEVGTSLLETIGVQFPSQASFNVIGTAGTPGTIMLPELQNLNSGLIQATISNPALVINMLHQSGGTNLLANPKIRVKNHEKASVHVGDKVPVITNTTTATGVISQSITYLDVGLKLDVEPTIYLGNDVGIKVGLEVSNITNTIQNSNGSLTYQLGTRNANTVLRLKDGETQMLAGLIDREDRKTGNSVPGLGELPIVGRLFSSNSDNATKTEVVLLITPHVVRNIVRPEAPVEEFSSGTESEISLERLELNTVEMDKLAKSNLQEHSIPLEKITSLPSDSKKIDAAVFPSQMTGSVPIVPTPSLIPIAGSIELLMEGPDLVSVDKDFEVKLRLNGKGAQNAYLDISFDPAQLKVVGVTEGDIIKSAAGKIQFLQQIQEKTGHINLGITGKESIPEKGEFAILLFRPLVSAAGKSELRIGAANIFGTTGSILPMIALPVKAVEIAK